MLTKNGTLSISDVDVGDNHSVSVAAQPGTLGTLTASVLGAGAGGTITWSYQVDEAEVSHLTAGQTVTETFTVTLTDEAGESSVQTITLTLVGTGEVASIVNLTPGTDTISLVSGNNAVVGNAAALNAPDQLTGGSDYDALALYNAGSFDLRTLAAFTGFEEVDLIDNTAGGQTATLYTPDGQNLLVAVRGNNDAVIWGGDGNETVNLAGGGYSEFHLGDGTNTVSNSKNGNSNIYFGAGTDTVTKTGGGYSNTFHLSSGTAAITATGSYNNYYYLSSGDVTIDNQAYDSSYFYFGTG